MKRRPDFVLLGAMKCATTALHEQLAAQSGVFLTDKQDEPSFFSDDDRYARGVPWYESLFEGAREGDLLGEASTHYTMQPTYPEAAQRMRAHLPDARLLYLVRHPIDRLVSHFVHDWSLRKVAGPLERAAEQHPELIAYGCYARQLLPWIEAYGRERILVVFTEALNARPDAEFGRVCRFLGVPGTPRWQERLTVVNAGSDRVRRGPFLDFVLHNRALQLLRRTLLPGSSRRWMRARFTLRERPTLSPATESRWIARFDEDLARFGAWFGVPDLRCANFREYALRGSEILDDLPGACAP